MIKADSTSEYGEFHSPLDCPTAESCLEEGVLLVTAESLPTLPEMSGVSVDSELMKTLPTLPNSVLQCLLSSAEHYVCSWPPEEVGIEDRREAAPRIREGAG